MSTGSNLSIASMNCRGLGNYKKRRDVFHFLKNKKFSICCLQDVHFNEKMEACVRSEWGLDCFFSAYTSNSRGVAILFNNSFEYKVHISKTDNNGNLLALDIEVADFRLTLINLYGPNNDEPAFYDKVCDFLSDLDNTHMILGGDWNLILDVDLDCVNYLHINNPRSRNRVLQLCHDLNLVDVWRIHNPDIRRYTWRQHDSPKQSRLDFFLISAELNSKLVTCDIKPGYRSDHSLIDIHLDFNYMERGRGYWKFNNSLLSDPSYVEVVKTTISELVKDYAALPYQPNNLKNIHPRDIQFTINDQLFFEMLLLQIRSKTISFAAWKKKEAGLAERELEREISDLHNKVCAGDLEAIEPLNSKQAELLNLRQVKMKGVLIRSKSRWMEQGEKPSKYFLNLEKRNFVNKSIRRIVTEDNCTLSRSVDILMEAREFYKKLYSFREIDVEVDLKKIFAEAGRNILTEDMKDRIEGPLLYDEITKALKVGKNGKSPGSDGFSYEFYNFFSVDLQWFLLRSLNLAYELGQLSVTQRNGIITLLPKGDKPRQFLKNWRPITLLNTSYKIASTCIANRLKQCLPYIIHDSQKGFMAGRFIGENIRMMYDLLYFTEINEIPGVLLSVDFEKAFDSVAHDFIYRVLDNFNFGPSIIRWIKLFYYHASSSVLVNGFLSETFIVKRGCRQGDGLSPYLFLLCAEVLSMMLHNDQNVQGIKVGDKEFLISQYADDTVLFLDGTERSMYNTFGILDCFASMSGLRVNIEKTGAVWIGSKKSSSDRLCKDISVNWIDPNDTFKILGITFSTNLESMVLTNYSFVIVTLKKLIAQWSKRNLTVFGRVTVVKSLLMSKLTYLILSLPNPPEDTVKELNVMFFNFIWKGQDRVSRSQMVQDYKEGGLRMVDVRVYIDALKITWLRRLLGLDRSGWVYLCQRILGINNLSLLEGGSMDLFPSQLTLFWCNRFWVDVLTAWQKFTAVHKPSTHAAVLKTTLWYNNEIKIGNKSIYYNHWFSAGIVFICDLLDDNGHLLSFADLRAKYNIHTNFIEYGGVVRLVKAAYRDLLTINSNVPFPFVPFNFQALLSDKKGSRRLYNSFTQAKTVTRKFVNKWERQLEIRFELDVWSRIFIVPFTCTLDSKLRWFQFRLIHRVLGTNLFLCKIHKLETNVCTFCKSEEETLIHLFCNCKFVLSFWSSVIDLIKNKTKIQLVIDNPLLLFGVTDTRHECLNLILLLARFHIYKMKMNSRRPSLEILKEDIKRNYCCEKYLASINGAYPKFRSKWQNYSAFSKV